MTPPKTDWRGLAARMRGDLDRADLNGRARRLAEFAIKATLMAGRTRVVIPNRMELCRLLKIGKTHVAEVSAALVSSRILSVKENADGWELLVFPDSSQWDVEWNHTREDMAAFLAMINRAPGQAQGELLPPPPSLARTLAEVSAENATGYQNGNLTRPPVTKMVTGQRPASVASAPKVFSYPPFKSFQESKDKRLLDFESLKGALLQIEGKHEEHAVAGIRQILGEEAMTAYGGIWRMNWRNNPDKTHRVLAAIVEDLRDNKVRVPVAKAKWYWDNFSA